MKIKDQLIIQYLRNNSRETLTNLSKKTSVPISTLYEKITKHQIKPIIRHTTLVDFRELGYNVQATVLLKIDTAQHCLFREFAHKHHSINSLMRVSSGFNFMLHFVCQSIEELEQFKEILENRFTVIEEKTLFILQDEFKEKFMTEVM